MPFLHIQLLGDFLLMADDEPVAGLHQARLQSFLAYLLRHCHAPQSRRQLAFLFWPDSTERQAQTNLRKMLYHLRNRLPYAAQFLQSDAQAVWWTPDTSFTVDTAEFEQKIAQAHMVGQQGDGAEMATLLAEAIALYRGEFLRGCYDEWILTEREAFHQQCLGALEQLIAWLEETREYPAAIRYGRRLLALDPLHEVAYQRLMHLYGLQGDRASALRMYHTCAEQLAHELNVEPSVATQEIYARLLQQESPTIHHPVRMPQRAASTRLVGREAEWRRLQGAWKLATNARPHFVLVAGEAGIGKTRLVEELRDWAIQQGVITVHARAYAAAGSLAYAPVIDWLGGELFQSALAQLEPVWRSEVARLLPDLLVQDPTLSPPEPLTERWQRQRLFDALTRLIRLIHSPLLLALDDLQWCDAETMEWLHYLLHTLGKQPDQSPTQTRLMVVGTVRAEELATDHALRPLLLELRRSGQVTEMELGPLDVANTAALARQAADRALDSDAVHQIVQASEGSPLFVVEMVRSAAWGVDGGNRVVSTRFEARRSESLPLPPKVQAVIEFRLEQLSPLARELAGLAAVIGRSFTFNVIAQATDRDEEILVKALDELWQRRIIREQGGDAYDFSHDRIRETTYAMISPPQRRHLHRRVATALSLIHADNLEAVMGQLAVHHERAGLMQQAIAYYQRAATGAQRLYAFGEHINYLQRAVALIRLLPATRENEVAELDLLIDLSRGLFATYSFGSPEAGRVLERALALCRSVGKNVQLQQILHNLALFYVNSGKLETAVEYAKQGPPIAQTLNNPILHANSCFMNGFTLFHSAQFTPALNHYQQARTLLSNVVDHPEKNASWHPPVALCLWIMGYPEQANNCVRQTLQAIKHFDDPFQCVTSLEYPIIIQYCQQDIPNMLMLAEKMRALADQYEIQMAQGLGMIYEGFARFRLGESVGQSLIRGGILMIERMNLVLLMPYYLSYLVEIFQQTEQYHEALDLLDVIDAQVERTGEIWWQAELLRWRGQVLLAIDSASDEGEACYRRALQIARQQAAKSLELRAATSLARLWQSQGKQIEEAHALLSSIYSWFTEGFDTPDLQAAKALLDELYTQIPS